MSAAAFNTLDTVVLEDFRANLIASVLDYIALQQQGDEKYSSGNNRKELMSWFKKSTSFRRVYEEAVDKAIILEQEKIPIFERELAGGLYESMSHHYFTSLQPPDRVVVSPNNTLNFFRWIYSNREVLSQDFDLSSIEGIGVPDGLLIEKANGIYRVIAICEYTLHGRKEYMESKHHNFREQQRKYPYIFQNSGLIMVTPKESNISSICHKFQETSSVEMPFTHKQYRDFRRGVVEHHRRAIGAKKLLEIYSNGHAATQNI